MRHKHIFVLAGAAALVMCTSSLCRPPRENRKPVNLAKGRYTVLMFDRAERSEGLRDLRLDNPLKRAWADKWTSPGQYFRWTVTCERAGRYRVDALVYLKPGQRVEIIGPENRLKITARRKTWDRIEASGDLVMPEGESTIEVRLLDETEAAFRCLHLLARDDEKKFYRRVEKFRSDASWLAEAKYGLMFQWGGWGYPRHGPAKKWPEMINDFDVEKFAEMCEQTGAGYVIWSATWSKFLFPAPIEQIEKYAPGHTCKRDLIGDIAEALHNRDMRLIMYYHIGCGSPWWEKAWVSEDDKEKFTGRLCSLFEEIGRRYGEKLDGIMVDDGMVLAPMDFERLGRAMKAGHDGRIIAFNSWVLPRMTEFQDFHFGEGNQWGHHATGKAGSGVITSGPQKGLQAHANFILDGPGWGVRRPDTKINPPRFSKEELLKLSDLARKQKLALSFNLLMYEDGSVSPKSLRAMKFIKSAVRDGK